MKHPYFFKQDHSYATALSLAYLGAQFYEQALDVSPLDIPTRRPGDDHLESALVLPLHARIVP